MNKDNENNSVSPVKTRARKRIKIKVEYDPDPPRCGNCKYKLKEQLAIPGKRPYRPMYCKSGGFATKSIAICNNWSSHDGVTLEN